MALTMTTQISDDVVVFRCDGRIVISDEGAALRERVRNTLTGTPKIVIDLCCERLIEGSVNRKYGVQFGGPERNGAQTHQPRLSVFTLRTVRYGLTELHLAVAP